MNCISNEKISIKVNNKGAELSSLVSLIDNREYLWQADPLYWNRHSPILFPIVGAVWNDKYRVDAEEFTMGRHGFARNMEFELVEQSESHLLFRLGSSETSLKLFPYSFCLEIGYRLIDNVLRVLWRVKNISSKTMFFQIGGHPAFNYKDYDENVDVQGSLEFAGEEYSKRVISGRDELVCSMLGEKGCVKKDKFLMPLEDGRLPIRKDTFKNNAIVLEQNGIEEIFILDRALKPYVSVKYDAPVVGIWSPKENEFSPFVCIEPWYGRCDREYFEGEFSQKDWVQSLVSGETFESNYDITII